GHSGMDIHRGRANANKLMNRVLLASGARISRIEGGGLRNAIPRESTAVVATAGDLEDLVKRMEATFRAEYRSTDPDLRLTLTEAAPGDVLPKDYQGRLLRAL